MTKAKQLTKAQIAQDWARKQSRATGTARHVLLIFAHYVNADTGIAYPTIETVAHEVGATKRTVFRNIEKLLALGELQVVSRHMHAATEYRIVGPAYDGDEVSPVSPGTSPKVSPVSSGMDHEVSPVSPGGRSKVTSETVQNDTRDAAKCHPCHPTSKKSLEKSPLNPQAETDSPQTGATEQ